MVIMTAYCLQQLLETALNTGQDVVVQLKQAQGETYRGRIQSLDTEGFTLFHSGSRGGVLWAFTTDDVATVGLLIDAHSELLPFTETVQNPVF
jgi:hypothetical protein